MGNIKSSEMKNPIAANLILVHLVADGLKVLVYLHPVSDKAADFLIAHHVPDTVTRQHQELVPFRLPVESVYITASQAPLIQCVQGGI